jgi:hypothetical protein
MIENNQALSVARIANRGFSVARLWPPKPALVNAARHSVAAMPSAARGAAPEHPPLVWITLWATGRNASQSLDATRFWTDCLNFKHGKIFENQQLA